MPVWANNEVIPLIEPLGALLFRWWRMLWTVTSWLSEANGPENRTVQSSGCAGCHNFIGADDS